MRRKPQLGAELRREDEDEKREQQLRFTFPAKEESSRSWTRMIELLDPTTKNSLGSLSASNPHLLLCLSCANSLIFFLKHSQSFALKISVRSGL